MIEKIKSGTFYKLMKTSEAVLMVTLPIIFSLLGWFELYPAIGLVAAYIAINLTNYGDKALWQTRDRVVVVVEELKYDIKDLRDEMKKLKEKL
jgi:hypothetical protein